MTAITIRNISESMMNMIRTLSKKDKRSINNELLLLIEEGMKSFIDKKINKSESVSFHTQLKIWDDICGQWEDDRSTTEIINDIVDSRTLGREINL